MTESGRGNEDRGFMRRIAWMVTLCMLLAGSVLSGCTAPLEEDGTVPPGSKEVRISGDGKVVIKPDRQGGAYLTEQASLTIPENPGYLRSVSPDGNLWGVNAYGEIWGTDKLSGEWDFSDVRAAQLCEDCVVLLRAGKEAELEVRSLQGDLLGMIDGKGATFEGLGNGWAVLRRGEAGLRVSVCRIDLTNRQLGEELSSLPNDLRGVFSQGSDEKSLYLYTSEAAYRYAFEEQTFYELFAWTDVGVFGTAIALIWKDAKGEIYVEGYDNREKFTRLSWRAEEELPKKKELKVAMLSLNSDGNMQKFVTEYNQSQEEYHVTIQKYENSPGGDLDDAWMRLSADMLGTDPPDLICLANWHHSEDLAEQGYLVDLKPYLAKSEILSEEDFYPEVLECGSYGEILYTIPYEFSMHTMSLPASQWKRGPGWTYDEFIDYCRAREEWRPMRGFFLMRMFLFNYTLDYFWDEKESHFDSGEFRHLLEFMKECKEKEGESPAEDRPFYVAEEDVRNLQTFADNLKERGEVVYVGYPGKAGQPRTVIEGTTELSIIATSKDQEGAWRFLEYCLGRDPQKGDFSTYKLFSNRNYTERLIEKELSLYGKDHEDILDEEGNVVGVLYSEHAIDQGCVDAFRETLSAAKPMPAGYNQVRTIVLEESQAYFENQKSLDQVTDAIQARVKLFLAE